ncbi:hypothetical protein [Streptomyces solaniscabiei]|uniref:hypothetical protein n=1 Tax=Streptomyces solaniscabiei TaxID=2683255 RepID=UPI001CE368DD|nr:hypothetical protein [Streptomyces solaniscabiei]
MASIVSPVRDAWVRIDAWLSERASLSRARLRPPAWSVEVADVERRPGVTLTRKLVASLHCHDGVELADDVSGFALNGPFADRGSTTA